MKDGMTRKRKIGLALLGTVLLVGLVHYCWGYYTSRAIEAKLRAIRDAGYPSSAQEADEFYPGVAASQNAGLIYQRAFLVFSDSEDFIERIYHSADSWPFYFGAFATEVESELTAFLSANQQFYRLLQEASEKKECRYEVDLSLGLGAPLGHLRGVQSAARALEIKVVAHARRGEAEELVKTMGVFAALVHSLDREPVLISWLVRSAILGKFTDALEQTINVCTLADEQLTRLSSLCEGLNKPELLARVIAGERSLGLSGFDAVGGPYRSWGKGLYLADKLSYIQYFDKIMAVCKLPIEERLRAGKKELAEASRFPLWSTPVSRMLVPARGLWRGSLKDGIRIRMMIAAIEIQSHKSRTGRLPKTWQELVPVHLESHRSTCSREESSHSYPGKRV